MCACARARVRACIDSSLHTHACVKGNLEDHDEEEESDWDADHDEEEESDWDAESDADGVCVCVRTHIYVRMRTCVPVSRTSLTALTINSSGDGRRRTSAG